MAHKPRMTTTPAWIPCPDDCGEFFCTIHKEHAHECPCPDIDAWTEKGLDPYVEGGPEA